MWSTVTRTLDVILKDVGSDSFGATQPSHELGLVTSPQEPGLCFAK